MQNRLMREVKNVYSLNIDKFSATQFDIEEKQKGINQLLL
jgi:hypothetical protein